MMYSICNGKYCRIPFCLYTYRIYRVEKNTSILPLQESRNLIPVVVIDNVIKLVRHLGDHQQSLLRQVQARDTVLFMKVTVITLLSHVVFLNPITISTLGQADTLRLLLFLLLRLRVQRNLALALSVVLTTGRVITFVQLSYTSF